MFRTTDFLVTAPSKESFVVPANTPTLYFQGILFVGDYNKKIDIFETFLSLIKKSPKKIVFIDDKRKNVEELENLTQYGIEYIGVHYTAIEHSKPIYFREIAEFQYKFLDQIMSNEEALLLMENNAIEIINNYFKNFEALAKSEKWEEIISRGTIPLKIAEATHRTNDEAKICAQLTSTAFYMGDYTQALKYANRCHELSEEFVDPSLFIRALYLESAIHRALAGKNTNEQVQQESYQLAVTTAEEAIQIYSKKTMDNENLKGKVYFNLGAAHADNPKGDLEKAVNCYTAALECFKNVNAVDDIIRTSIRLGKVYLLQKKYDLSQEIINEVRSQLTSERLAMHTDYLEAQLKFALHDFPNALQIANNGLARAKSLGAKEDEIRLNFLIESVNQSTAFTNTSFEPGAKI